VFVGQAHGWNPAAAAAIHFLRAARGRDDDRLGGRNHVAVLKLLRVLQCTHQAVAFHAAEAGIGQVFGDRARRAFAATEFEEDIADDIDGLARSDVYAPAAQGQFRTNFRRHDRVPYAGNGSGWLGSVASHTDLVCMKQRMPSKPFSRP